MTELEKMFPSLTKFSDLNWEEVSREYAKVQSKISFPEYLQIKAEEGDCPDYLFELAFYEMACAEALNPAYEFPKSLGIHLNPTALFLSLEYDVQKMLQEAILGKIEVIPRQHVLCLYKDRTNKVKTIEVDEEALEILEYLENGPQPDLTFLKEQDHKEFMNLVNLNIVFNITN